MYTGKQVARLVMPDMSDHTGIEKSTIKVMFLAKGIYKNNANYRHFFVIRDVVKQEMEKYPAVNIPAIEA